MWMKELLSGIALNLSEEDLPPWLSSARVDENLFSWVPICMRLFTGRF